MRYVALVCNDTCVGMSGEWIWYMMSGTAYRMVSGCEVCVPACESPSPCVFHFTTLIKEYFQAW